MKRLSAVVASLVLAAVVAVGGAGAANAASATWNQPAKKVAKVEPMPDWGPGWCFTRSAGGWQAYPCK